MPAIRHSAVLASVYPPVERDLLVGLPARVVLATTATRPGGPSGSIAAGLAGLNAIAAGRASDSDLVRLVVAAIYAETGGPAVVRPSAPAADRAGMLAVCLVATRVLARRADPGDSAAYRQWLQTIAVRAGADAGLIEALRVALRLG